MIDINRALLLEEGSAEMEKIKLIRAVQVCTAWARHSINLSLTL